MLVRPEMVPMFEAVPYVTPIRVDFEANNPAGAAEYARRAGMRGVIVTQVDGNPERNQERNFILDQWKRTGLSEDAFRSLPLMLETNESAFPSSPKPVLAYCLNGHSSPFNAAPEFAAWLRGRFGARYTLLDIGSMRLPSVVDLHPILCRCHRLITIDTSVLHLSYASAIPTVALQRNHQWYQSEPRRHWVARLTYEDAQTDAGRKRIVEAVEGEPQSFLHFGERRIIHAVNSFPAAGEAAARVAAARRSWQCVNEIDSNYAVREIPTGSRSAGERNLPYIRDLFDAACACAGVGDIVLFTNSDIHLCREATAAIRIAMERAPCCYSHRADFAGDVPGFLHRHELSSRPHSTGIDLFAFTPAFWAQARRRFPDVLLGAEGWDSVLRWIMDEANPLSEIMPPICAHRMHTGFWESHPDSFSQCHNRALCREWAEQNGYAAWIHPGRYLFRAEPKRELDGAFVNYISHWYSDPDQRRRREIEDAMLAQADCPEVKSVRILAMDDAGPLESTPTDHRPTFAELAALGSDDPEVVNLLVNSDCHIDRKDMAKLRNVPRGKIWCLSRQDSCVACSQDAWIWRGPLNVPEANYTQGVPGCDNRFAFDCASHGLIPTNPARSIRLHHRHATNLRRYTAAQRIMPPYLFVEPSDIAVQSRMEFRGDPGDRRKIESLSQWFADCRV